MRCVTVAISDQSAQAEGGQGARQRSSLPPSRSHGPKVWSRPRLSAEFYLSRGGSEAEKNFVYLISRGGASEAEKNFVYLISRGGGQRPKKTLCT